MKISEAVEKLLDLQRQHGDLPLYIHDPVMADVELPVEEITFERRDPHWQTVTLKNEDKLAFEPRPDRLVVT